MIHGYKELIVWQKAMDLVTEVYTVTEQFPREELFGLTSQLRRAAISIASNIAEGRSRGTKNDYLHFLRTSYSSGAEVETQIEIGKRLNKTKNLNYTKVDKLLTDVMKMLYVMIRNLNPNQLQTSRSS